MNSETDTGFHRRVDFSPHLAQVSQWIGPRRIVLDFDPSQVNQKRWIAIVASHHQSNSETNSPWREAIESAMRRCKAEDLALIACRATPVGDYLLHVAKRFSIPTIELLTPRPQDSLSDWESSLVKSSQKSSDPFSQTSYLRISPLITAVQDSPEQLDGPLADLAMIAIADFVHAIDVRKNGRIDRILRRRLASATHPLGSIVIDLTPPEDMGSKSNAIHELMDLGAVGWYRPSKYDLQNPMTAVEDSLAEKNDPDQALARQTAASRSRVNAAAHQAYCPVFSTKLIEQTSTSDVDSQWKYLTHCTRSPKGPWPDQSISGYYDEMLTESNHSHPLDTLIRILKQQRLIATDYLKRTDVATVSLSQVPLQELLARRTFQRHLHRWDWEPYGICIQTHWLEQKGCRPVFYGTKSDFQKLPHEDQPFFQIVPEGNAWDREREWRIADDIRLAEIPATDAFVFVPSVEEALRVSSISRFPVMIVESCTDPKRQS